MVNRAVIIRKKSTVHNYIELSMCVPVIHMECCRRGLGSAKFQTPATQVLG